MNRIEAIQLQIMMAFGQGAGTMLASFDAIESLMTQNRALIERAAADWDASRWAFLELARSLGQIAATRAAMASRWQIEPTQLNEALQVVLIPCPCREAS